MPSKYLAIACLCRPLRRLWRRRRSRDAHGYGIRSGGRRRIDGPDVRGGSALAEACCRIIGCSARRSAWGWTRGITFGSSIEGIWRTTRYPRPSIRRPPRRAASRHRPLSSSMPRVTWSIPWGGPGQGYDWPTSNHGIVVDHMDNVWIGGNGAGDSHVLKFSRAGDFLMQVGESGHDANSNATNHFSRVAKVTYDGPANEMYLADGYGNKRVAVIDATNGDLKRFWGCLRQCTERRQPRSL